MGTGKSIIYPDFDSYITYSEFDNFMQQMVGNGELTKKEIKKFRKLRKQLLIPISYRKLKNLQDSISFNPLNKSNDMSYDMSDKEIIAIDDLKLLKDFYNLMCELLSKDDDIDPIKVMKSAFKTRRGFDMPQSIETFILINKNLPLKL